MRLEVSERVGVVAPTLALGCGLVLRGRAALDAPHEPLEHLQGGRATEAVRPGYRCGERADRPAVVDHSGVAGGPTAAVTAQRRPPALDVPKITQAFLPLHAQRIEEPRPRQRMGTGVAKGTETVETSQHHPGSFHTVHGTFPP